MGDRILRVIPALLAVVSLAFSQPATNPQLKTATTHPMQYYISLPDGWTARKSWPVVLAVESANRDFEGNAAEFVKARGDLPFIVTVPLTVTNGGPNVRGIPAYHYSDAVWAEIDKNGPFRFDSAGIDAVLSDVRRLNNGEDRCFITGWEAGGHTLWAMIFRHPEMFRAVAPVSTNYLGRWMDESAFSADPSRAELPVRLFESTAILKTPFVRQSEEAIRLARAHGFQHISRVTIDKPHGALAGDVLAYFASLLK